MIESVINLALKRMSSDPKRSIRNIIELAFNNSHGRFQRELFKGAQKMLENENSAYYTLAERVISNIDHDIIKTFGINLGYNGCTCGAERIRQNENEYGFNIPWSFNISSRKNSENFSALTSALIVQGMALGVYTYFIFGGISVSDEALEIYREFKDCAFVTICDSDFIDEALLKRLDGINNLMLTVNSNDREQLLLTCDMMKSHKRLYSIYFPYSNEDAEQLVSEENLKFCEQTGATFIGMIPRDECSDETRDMMKKSVLDIRMGQLYPFFAADFQSDMLLIDHIISDDTCWVAFDTDGTVFSSTGHYDGEEYSLLNTDLSNILRKVTPPKISNK